jgi:hypothetical protein
MALKQFGERSVIGGDGHVSVTAIATKTHHPVATWAVAVHVELPAMALKQGRYSRCWKARWFLDAYQVSRGRTFSVEEREVAWAASFWPALYNAREEILYDTFRRPDGSRPAG